LPDADFNLPRRLLISPVATAALRLHERNFIDKDSMKATSLLLIVVLAVASGVAQRGGSDPGPGFKYDAGAETKLTGTIEQINTMDTMCHTGTHLVLKTDKGDVEVALGPSQFLEDQKLELRISDDGSGQKNPDRSEDPWRRAETLAWWC
jgi:hypothetical protein